MSEQVRTMFAEIAPSYDRTNSVLSMGIHHLWRRRAVAVSGAKLGDAVLDCATGTGDLALGFKATVGETGRVVGTDFCAEMMETGPAKSAARRLPVTYEVADAMALPYPTGSFDIASISFGIRNVDDPVVCLREMGRVVRPGGRVVVLEFGQPSGLFGAVYRWYSSVVIPFVGGLLSGRRAAYDYLPRTSAAFPAEDRFVGLMKQSGAFSEMRYERLTLGIAVLYVGLVGARKIEGGAETEQVGG
ncbi:MAG: bifunctional demethylmenaquinone methyltransferase/2-methoxy-6-polyprenyl-1,4-benzoquinol methylase UbiE [Deltaproteobacteria bacterium]|nr:bifunctional demethylmenaquinone methyltransferase/2-methoxy-6-polyprenyl-1,4-benzoquinol methylase UbiE [Deltaproteobacteria bacterium]